ncbi:MAG: hypothetical protein FWH43_02625 [Endomicrobia bacterium]|nr:hypothetical protein [Endomicrobiia bacterium]
MKKKNRVAMLGMFTLSSLSFAGEGFHKGHKKMDTEQKAKFEAVKKEKTEYLKKLQRQKIADNDNRNEKT